MCPSHVNKYCQENEKFSLILPLPLVRSAYSKYLLMKKYSSYVREKTVLYRDIQNFSSKMLNVERRKSKRTLKVWKISFRNEKKSVSSEFVDLFEWQLLFFLNFHSEPSVLKSLVQSYKKSPFYKHLFRFIFWAKSLENPANCLIRVQHLTSALYLYTERQTFQLFNGLRKI